MKLIKRAIALTLLFMVAAVPVAGAATVEDFSFKDINGQTHRFSDYRGKWVVVNYWATYCGPCLEELPALNGAAKRFKDKLVILGMEAGETPTGELKQFVQQKKISYPVMPTQDSTMYAMGLLYGVPTTFIVNPEGEIVDTHMGAVTVAQLQSYVHDSRSGNRSAVATDKKSTCDSDIC